nr:MAG TPA: hypothetical protein [Caudoviricetes sp.]
MEAVERREARREPVPVSPLGRAERSGDEAEGDFSRTGAKRRERKSREPGESEPRGEAPQARSRRRTGTGDGPDS